MKKTKGVSLIVLVITIVVILILVAAVVLELSNNGMQNQAKEAKFKSNVDSYKSQLSLAISNEYTLNEDFEFSSLNASTWEGGEVDNTIKQYIPSITDSDAKKFAIQAGKLVYIGDKEIEKNWFEEMVTSTSNLCINIIAEENMTVNGETASYSNPIVPKGFKAINTSTNWPIDWNKGLVIEDENGNQFVWVPADNINVQYIKNFDFPSFYDATKSNTSDGTLPSGITESSQITRYGGFYIGRYEAGKENIDTLVSKKDMIAWVNISHTDAKAKSEAMYNTDRVKSGLLTGTQWDTLMIWLENANFNVRTNSTTWGNFKDSTPPANITGYGTIQLTGFSEYWKANNIYDIAGNAREWTNEIYSTHRITRGGSAINNGIERPPSYRSNNNDEATESYAFRVALFIM